jgi:hypothetical protein
MLACANARGAIAVVVKKSMNAREIALKNCRTTDFLFILDTLCGSFGIGRVVEQNIALR